VTRVFRLAALGACAVVSASTFAAAQSPAKGAGIAGVVRDTAGNPLPLVTVKADGKDLSDVTGSDGRFFIAGLPGGNNDFTVTRGGFRTMTFTATLTTDSTLVLALKLHRVNTLAAISITAPAAIAQLKRSGFYDRERAGLGSFLTPQHIDSVAVRHQMTSQLMQDMNGIEVACASAGRCTVQTRRAHGCLRLFVDGQQMPGDEQVDDVVPIGEVAAMEVYANPNTVPTEFQGKLPAKRSTLTAKAGCGAILVWTRARLDKK
jgi:hypothetical protein